MKNLILTGLVFVTAVSLSFGQLKVVAPNGNVKLGTISTTTLPQADEEKLNVGGGLNLLGRFMRVGYRGNQQAAKVQIGVGRTSGGNAMIEVFGTPNGIGDVPTGKLIATKNGLSSFTHSGTGRLEFSTSSATALQLRTNNTARMHIAANGRVGIGTESPSKTLTVNGDAAKVGSTTWATFSDKRLKENINQYGLGLEAILKINPVTFNYNGKAGIKDTESTFVGLIAQEYQKIVPSAVEEFTYTEMIDVGPLLPMKKGASENYLTVNPNDITYMLVNAVKEQQSIIKELQEEVRSLKSTGVSNTTNSTSVLIAGSGAEKAMLSQNTPNPFTSNTKIDYYVPENTATAVMSFTDISGKEIKRIAIDSVGSGSLDVSIKEMPIGIYSYSLVVDGSTIATKKMVLSR